MRWNGKEARTPRLLIGDVQPMIGDALAALVSSRGYDVVAQAHDMATAVAVLNDTEIDIALLAADMVNSTVLTAIANLRRKGRMIALVITAAGPDDDRIDALLGGLNDGMILKDGGSEWLFHCLASINTGGHWHDPRAVAGSRARRDTAAAASVLTRREAEIARHVAGGSRNRDIAHCLGISEGTVKMHLHNAYAKLGVESRTQLAMDARVRSLA